MLAYGMPALIEPGTLEDCARLCRELGLEFVELNMNLPQYQTDRLEVRRCLEIQEKYGVYFTLHLDENLNPADFNPYVAEAYLRTVEDAAAFAGAAGISILNMHLSKGVYFTMPDRRIFLYDEYREQYLERMRTFRDRCGDRGVRICVENSDGFTAFQIEALDLLLEHPAFGLTFDIGHNHSTGGRDEEVILRRRERLCHFHLHDGAGKKNHLPLGKGEIDLEKYFRLAESCGGSAVLEVKTLEGLRQSVDWLRRFKSQAGHLSTQKQSPPRLKRAEELPGKEVTPCILF